MNVLWGALIASHAAVTVFAVVWGRTERWFPSMEAKSGRLFLGFLLGATAAVSMAMSTEVVPGFDFDLRHPLIAASGLFGGPLAAVVTAVIAALFQVCLGGAGAFAGGVGIAVSAGIGLAGHYTLRRSRRSFPALTLFSSLVGLGVLSSFLAISPPVRSDLLHSVGLPLVVLTFLGTMVTVMLIETELQRRQTSEINRMYRAMVMSMPDCLNIKDIDGRFLVANHAMAEVMGTANERDLIGRTDFDFYPEHKAREFREEELAIMKGGHARQVEQLVEYPDGATAWLSTMKVPMRNAKGELIGLITHNRDVTELHTLAVQKEQFISTASHELRSPVTAIRGAMTLLASGKAGDLPPKAAKLVAAGERSARHLAELIDDILDFEKVISGNMDFEPSDLAARDAVQDALDAITHYLPGKNVETEIIDDAAGAMLHVNPKRLHQVLTNLMSNAVKFSPDGGAVTVGITRAGGFIDIAVHDRGPGVPPQFEDHLFERYSQDKIVASKSGIAGTGLGLSIAKEMIGKMNGDIRYRRSEGITEFSVRLPELRASPVGQAEESPPALDQRQFKVA